MDFSIATVLAQFTDDKLIAGKVLEKRLGYEDEDNSTRLQVALDALEKIGILTKDLGKYRRVQADEMVEAKLRCSSKGFCFAIQDREGAEDIYIRESHLNTAWNGDRVLISVVKEGSRRRSPEGAVKVILDRANPSLLARVTQSAEGNYRAVPLDDRLLFEIDLQQPAAELAAALDHLVHVEIVRYPLGQNPPIGRVTKVLGSDAEAAADTDIVCCKHDLPQAFSDEARAAAAALAADATAPLDAAVMENRRDLRDVLTVTLEDATLAAQSLHAIETAFSLEKTDEEQWLLAIHIADFAHYIAADSPLDREARRRSTAVYLGDLTLPLFPTSVVQACSLQLNRDRLAVSIMITLDGKGCVESFEICESVVGVDAQLTYQQVQALLGGQAEVPGELEESLAMLEQLFFTLAPLVKAQRLQRGGFELVLTDLSFAFKDEGWLGAIAKSLTLPLPSLLSELTTLAGKAVADHCRNLGLPAFYCIQTEPDPMELEDFLKLSNNLKLDLSIAADEEVRPQDYQNFTQAIANSTAPKVLMAFLRSTLKSPLYSTKPGAHFGLAYGDGYCQVTSPGQRYADLAMQRLLHDLFEKGRDRRTTRSKQSVKLGSSECHRDVNWNVLPAPVQTQWESDLAVLIHPLNEQIKTAQDAEADLEGLKKAEHMKERTGENFQGLIVGVQSYGFFVEIEELLVEGLVHVSSLKDDWYEYRARHSCLVGRKNRTAYRLGDRVEVQVKSVDYYRQQIDLVTVGGGSEASNEEFEDE
ncbi:MAG: VacB/RNase II family 3'-5' exoribonuclease [Spirulinaceae cyanobacterium SM2_1_0]|nr:VacB/RNase II family 3'-5' exoribonuclease [Spirulinaceae cyanobacterium SM2_1_0]